MSSSAPVQIVGPADTAPSGPADTAPGGGGGWFLLKFTNGAVGLQKVAPGAATPRNATHAAWIAPHTISLPSLLTNYSAKLAQAIGQMASANQAAALMSQLDHGAGMNAATSWLYVGPDKNHNPVTTSNQPNHVSANTSTALKSEAVAANIIPTPSLSTGLQGDLIRVLEAVGAVLLMVVGLHALIGGPSATEVIGTAAKVVK